MAENEVVIRVRARNDTGTVFKGIETEARRSGDRTGDNFRTGLSGKLINALQGVGAKLTESVASAAGKIPGMISSAVGSLPPLGQVVAAAIGLGLAAALAPVLAAAIVAALLLAVGGGVLAAGIASAMRNDRVTKAFEGLKEQGTKLFEEFGKPFEKPLIRAAKTFERVLKDLREPIKELGETIAPVIDRLAPALGEFLKNMMPGIQSAVEASVPLFNTLADKLPGIGRAISMFFDKIASAGPDAQVFFEDLLDLITGLIVVLGDVISWLARMYVRTKEAVSGMIRAFTAFGRAVLGIFDRMLDGAVRALGWVPGLGDKLRGAQTKFREFRDRANGYLDGIDKSVTVTARFRVIGLAAARAATSVARTLSGMGYAHGGIVGAATGGIHSGLRLVGEAGPELVNLPPGSQVHSNPDTQRMMGQASGLLGRINSGLGFEEDLSYRGSGNMSRLADAFWAQHKGWNFGGGGRAGQQQVTPEVMKQWLQDFIAQGSRSAGGSADGVPIVLQVDGQVIARAILPGLQKINRTQYAGNVTRMFPATR